MVEVRVPAIGESITEVELGEWLKSPGDPVRADEPLVVLETEKASLELPSPAAGVLRTVRKQKGERARIGEVIAELEPAAAAPAPAPPGPAAGAAGPPPEVPAWRSAAGPGGGAGAEGAADGSPAPARAAEGSLPSGGTAAVPTPAPTARAAPEPATVRSGAAPDAGPRPAPPPAPEPEQAAPGVPRAGRERRERPVRMTAIRRRIAERLVQAQQAAALLTTFNEVDMTQVAALRRTHQERFRERHGVKLGLMSFFVRATVEALGRVPELNAEVRGPDIVYREYCDVGIAVAGGRGLVVPVLRDADRMGFADIERAVADFAVRAEAGRLGPEELLGGTFTISNGGVFGSLLSTPIVNPPQSGILGLHAIQDRPVARDGAVVVRPMMYVALTYDHRVVDGREAVTFLRAVKESVEEPARLLFEI